MQDKTYQARVAALSLAQCNTVVTLLRAHGEDTHANSMEAAMNVVVGIVSDELGRDHLASAMTWVSEELGGGRTLNELVTAPH